MCRGYKALSILPIPRLEGMEDFCQLEASKLTEVQQSGSLGLKKKQTTEANSQEPKLREASQGSPIKTEMNL